MLNFCQFRYLSQAAKKNYSLNLQKQKFGTKGSIKAATKFIEFPSTLELYQFHLSKTVNLSFFFHDLSRHFKAHKRNPHNEKKSTKNRHRNKFCAHEKRKKKKRKK